MIGAARRPGGRSKQRMDVIRAYLNSASVSGWDVVDILVVAIALYEFMKLIRGTRAVQMAVGSSIIGLLFFASHWAPLQTVNWLVRNMFGYVVFAAIVIFQSDIRRALAHFGRTPFFRYFSRRDNPEETVEELIVAATCSRTAAPGPSSCSSATSACGTTSRAGFRSTPP